MTTLTIRRRKVSNAKLAFMVVIFISLSFQIYLITTTTSFGIGESIQFIERDDHIYIDGSKGKAFPVDRATWGQKYNLTVWCAVHVRQLNDRKLAVIEQSWGKHCDKLLYVYDHKKGDQQPTRSANSSHVQLVPINTKVADGVEHVDLWEKAWKFLVYLATHHRGEYDYLLKADTDTWFSVNNFKAFATYFDPQLSWYMGHTLLHEQGIPMQAGGNCALSRGLIETLVQKVLNSSAFLQSTYYNAQYCNANTVGWAEDLFLAECLQTIHIWPLNTLNEKYQLRWSPFSDIYTEYLRFNRSVFKNNWFWKHRVETFPEGEECCDEHMISFHDFKSGAASMKSRFDTLDALYTTDEIKHIQKPSLPTTFLFGKSMKWRHDHIQIEL